MILTCPACSMRYLVAEGAIGSHGRRVRCAHCGHQWREEAEEGLDEALFGEDDDAFAPPRRQEAPPSIDFSDDEDISLSKEDADDEATDFQSILRKEIEGTPIPEGVRPVADEHDPVLAQLLKDKAEAKGRNKKARNARVAGFLAACTMYILVLAAFFAFHEQISRAWPPSNLLYTLAGLPPALPGEGLTLEDLTAEMHDDRIVMKGSVINLKSIDMKVPSVMASVVDKDGKIIDRVLIAPPVARLKAEGRAAFDAVYPSVPEGAVNVTFAFSYVKAEKPAEEKAAAPDAGHGAAEEHAPEEEHAAPAHHAPHH